MNGSDRKVEVSIYDLQGRLYSISTKDVSSNRVINLDLSNFENGIYVLSLNSDTVNKSIKIVKTN